MKSLLCEKMEQNKNEGKFLSKIKSFVERENGIDQLNQRIFKKNLKNEGVPNHIPYLPIIKSLKHFDRQRYSLGKIEKEKNFFRAIDN